MFVNVFGDSERRSRQVPRPFSVTPFLDRTQVVGRDQNPSEDGPLTWDDLRQKERDAFKLLGYTEESWTADEDVYTMDIWWDELTEEQREAALLVGYTEEEWTMMVGARTTPPTKSPTVSPTKSPTKNPTKSPTKSPTDGPTRSPTKNPTGSPTESPSGRPSAAPTDSPTNSPTRSAGPTAVPTSSPSETALTAASVRDEDANAAYARHGVALAVAAHGLAILWLAI